MLPTVPFTDALKDVSAGNAKIPQAEFLSGGQLAVVDQGRSLVAGFTDDRKAAVRSPAPLIVFGDHTRAIKFIDFPFAIGADGVKVLQVRDGFDPKFVYHYLRSHPIPSAGYSRHFKFLKEVAVPRPPLAEQRRIAAILDQADAIRTKRRQVLAHLDSLIQAIFHEMFGSPDTWPSRWPISTIGELAESVQYGTSSRAGSAGDWPVLRMGNLTDDGRLLLDDLKWIDLAATDVPKYTLRTGDMLFNRTNSAEKVGKSAVVDTAETFAYAGYLVRVRFNPVSRSEFVAAYLTSPHGAATRRRLAKAAVNQANISASEMRRILIADPPLDTQAAFAARIASIKGRRPVVEQAIATDDELFASLQCRAFRGEL